MKTWNEIDQWIDTEKSKKIYPVLMIAGDGGMAASVLLLSLLPLYTIFSFSPETTKGIMWLSIVTMAISSTIMLCGGTKELSTKKKKKAKKLVKKLIKLFPEKKDTLHTLMLFLDNPYFCRGSRKEWKRALGFLNQEKKREIERLERAGVEAIDNLIPLNVATEVKIMHH